MREKEQGGSLGLLKVELAVVKGSTAEWRERSESNGITGLNGQHWREER